MKITKTEDVFDKQVRSFLIAVSMLNVVLGMFRLNEETQKKCYTFNDEDVNHAIQKVYKAYKNIEMNHLEGVWNKTVINNLLKLIESAQEKVSEAVVFVNKIKNSTVNNRNVAEVLSFEYDSMEDLKVELNDRLNEIQEELIYE